MFIYGVNSSPAAIAKLTLTAPVVTAACKETLSPAATVTVLIILDWHGLFKEVNEMAKLVGVKAPLQTVDILTLRVMVEPGGILVGVTPYKFLSVPARGATKQLADSNVPGGAPNVKY